MPMRLQVGAFAVECERHEDAEEFLRRLVRQLNNKEVAGLLGVTDKTVRRWRRAGRLPGEPGGQVSLLELLQYLGPQAPDAAATAIARPLPARERANKPPRAGGTEDSQARLNLPAGRSRRPAPGAPSPHRGSAR